MASRGRTPGAGRWRRERPGMGVTANPRALGVQAGAERWGLGREETGREETMEKRRGVPISLFFLFGAFQASRLLHMPDILVAEGSRLRLALLKFYARFEVQLLKVFWFVFHTPLVRIGLTRRFLYRAVARFLAEHAIAGQFMTLDEVHRFIDALPDQEGSVAVGPCRCRLAVGKRARCPHPMETDIVIAEGAPIWLDLFPKDYRVIGKEEAKEIVERCYRQGMAPGVYRHMYYRGSRNYFVICNCCKDACIPVIGYRVFKPEGMKFINGRYHSLTDPARCAGCGTCVEACPFEERVLRGGVAVPLNCRGCGLCASRCPRGAAYMVEREEGMKATGEVDPGSVGEPGTPSRP